MSTVERALGGPEIEVVAKATRRRLTLEYKRKIVREADGCKTPGAVGVRKRRGPALRVAAARDKLIAEQARDLTRWKYRAERAEALVELPKRSRCC